MSYTIEFFTGPGKTCGEYALPEFTDEAIERVRLRVERRLGRPLDEDSGTGYPTFAVYEDGKEIGGG